jgi:tungstate transport system permease protein
MREGFSTMQEIVDGFWNALRLLMDLDRELLTITLLSLRVSSTAVLLAAFMAVPAGIITALLRFPGKNLLRTLLNTFMGFPPVVMGLVVFLLLSNQGPLGEFNLLYSPEAMILVQFLLAFPIIMGVTLASIESVDQAIRETAMALGASETRAMWKVILESRRNIVAGIILAFGQAISEVGAITIVGGNVRWQTRALTTRIVRELPQGESEFAIALGIVLLSLSFLINIALTFLQTKDFQTSTILTLALETFFIVNLSLFRKIAGISSKELLDIQLWLLLTIPVTTYCVGKALEAMRERQQSYRTMGVSIALISLLPWRFSVITLLLKAALVILFLLILTSPHLDRLQFHDRRTLGSILLSLGVVAQLYDAFFPLLATVLLITLPMTISLLFLVTLWWVILQKREREKKERASAQFAEIRCSNLSKKFEEPDVLSRVSLQVRRGEIVSILGPSGAGKSTILRILSGFLKPDCGEYEIDVQANGSTVNLEDKRTWLRRNSTLVHQNPTMFDESAQKNIEFGLRNFSLPTKERESRLSNALHQTGLSKLASRDARTLSSGEKQRLALARAIGLSSPILFVDEPTSNLDPANVKRIEDSLKALNEQGTTIVMATHNLFQARRLSNRVVLLLDGKIIEAAAVQEFFDSPKDPRTLAFIRGDMVY